MLRFDFGHSPPPELAHTLPTNFASYLQTLRSQKGLSKADLARDLEVSRAFISQVESGVRTPSRDRVEKIIQVLNFAVNSPEAQQLRTLAGFSPQYEAGNTQHDYSDSDFSQLLHNLFIQRASGTTSPQQWAQVLKSWSQIEDVPAEAKSAKYTYKPLFHHALTALRAWQKLQPSRKRSSSAAAPEISYDHIIASLTKAQKHTSELDPTLKPQITSYLHAFLGEAHFERGLLLEQDARPPDPPPVASKGKGKGKDEGNDFSIAFNHFKSAKSQSNSPLFTTYLAHQMGRAAYNNAEVKGDWLSAINTLRDALHRPQLRSLLGDQAVTATSLQLAHAHNRYAVQLYTKNKAAAGEAQIEVADSLWKVLLALYPDHRLMQFWYAYHCYVSGEHLYRVKTRKEDAYRESLTVLATRVIAPLSAQIEQLRKEIERQQSLNLSQLHDAQATAQALRQQQEQKNSLAELLPQLHQLHLERERLQNALQADKGWYPALLSVKDAQEHLDVLDQWLAK